ncbi:hypothetical protein K2173_027398 [Erythroxylum novogranatense]|uniref:CLAVATA3/ESR (CLE)-related protein 13 n=1 Tax=Erythroxylum novogranatense TaxID=1862640 RepID=A0AAV8TZ00_9ROSI|nr:hypothetical protein K2173_027398 [Erythroxylum novogranatense]
MKTSMPFFTALLRLSLCLLLFQFWRCNFFSSVNTIHYNTTPSTSASDQLLRNRKMLATKFDFKPFLRSQHQHHRRHHRHIPLHREPVGGDIDKRYGDSKRLVPTGPNPLHH